MPKFPNASEEIAAIQRDEALSERPQDRYSGRLKFTGCRQCGSRDGMQAVHESVLAEMTPAVINWIKCRQLAWYREPGNGEYLFYPCSTCNRSRIIPDKFMITYDIQAWLDRDPMAPDYDALAAEEPVSQITDARESTGLEG